MSYQIFQALEESFYQELFKEKSQTYWPSLKKKKIQSIKISKISPDWAKDTCLVRYKILFGKGIEKTVRGTAQTDKSKKKTWQIINYLYSHHFQRGDFLIARPLDFIAKINLLLYEEAPGKPFSLLVEKGNYSQLENYFKKTASWLTKLHNLSLAGNKFKKAAFLGLRGYLGIFEEIKKLMPDLKKDLDSLPALSFVDKIWKKERALIHNDFYPGNIIVSGNTIYGIDFDRAGIGPPLTDVAALYGALEFPQEVWELNLSKKEISSLQGIFLKTYCRLRKVNYQKTKKQLPLFLAKTFLDQIHYYAAFLIRGWKFMDKETRKSFSLKIKSLILKVQKWL